MQTQQNRNRLYIALALIVVIIGIVLLVAHGHHPKNKQPNHNPANSAVSIAPSGIVYPKPFEELGEVPVSDEQAGVISEASTPTTSPQTTVIIRSVPGQLAKNFNISTLPDQVSNSLTKSISNYKLISKSVMTVQSYPAVAIQYSERANGKTSDNEMFVIPTQKSTYYATYSTSGSSLSSFSSDITSINNSLAGYIKTH